MSRYISIVNSTSNELAITSVNGLVASPAQIAEFLSKEQVDAYYAKQGWAKVDFNLPPKGINTYVGMVTAVCPVMLGESDFLRCIHRVNFVEGNYGFYGEGENKSKYIHPFLTNPVEINGNTIIAPTIEPDGGMFTFFDVEGLGESTIVAPSNKLGIPTFKLKLSAINTSISALGTNPELQAQVSKLRSEIFVKTRLACTQYGINTGKQFDMIVVGFVTNLDYDHSKKNYKIPSITLTTPVFSLYIRECKIGSSSASIIINKLKLIAPTMGVKEGDFVKHHPKAKAQAEANNMAEANAQFTKAAGETISGKGTKKVAFTQANTPTTNTPKNIYEVLRKAKLPTTQGLALAYVALNKANIPTAQIKVALANALKATPDYSSLGKLVQELLMTPAAIDVATLNKVYAAVASVPEDTMLKVMQYVLVNDCSLTKALAEVLSSKLESVPESKPEFVPELETEPDVDSLLQGDMFMDYDDEQDYQNLTEESNKFYTAENNSVVVEPVISEVDNVTEATNSALGSLDFDDFDETDPEAPNIGVSTGLNI